MNLNAGPAISIADLSVQYRVPMRAVTARDFLRSLFAREYQMVDALDGISLTVAHGEILALIGPNGSGKTTTLKALAGLLHPTHGSIWVNGLTPKRRSREFLKSIALVLGQRQQLSWDIPPNDSFVLNRVLYEIPKHAYQARLENLTSMLDAREIVNRPVRMLSLGERMKCEIINSLLHSPSVVFLDEPTLGLDILTQRVLREFFRRYREETNATIILTSHYMADVAGLCDRVVALSCGTINFDGPLSDVHELCAKRKLVQIKHSSAFKGHDIHHLGEIHTKAETGTVLCCSTDDIPAMLSTLSTMTGVEQVQITDFPFEDAILELALR